VTNETWGGAAPVSGWSMLSNGQKASVIVTGALVLCLGVLTVIGALAGTDPGTPGGSPPPTPARSAAADR
jgi:fumarate reductase subunit D